MFLNYILFPIYLDYSSTTPVDPRVLERMLPYFYYKFGNYSSKSHIFGWNSNNIIEISRKNISIFLNCNIREIIWTSSSTESNNLAIKSFSFFYKNKGNHILSIKTEHKSILECLKYLTQNGFDVTFLDLKINGLINFVNFINYIKNKTILISLSYVNNEIGVIQNILYISKLCKEKKIFLHIDASQSIGKIFIDLEFLKIDMISISSHKIYGPKGIALLYLRRKSNLYFKPIIHGGGQEKNLRSGTLPTPLIVGFSETISIIKDFFFFDNFKIKNLKNILFIELLKIDSIYLNGDLKYKIPHILNINFNFIEGESLLMSVNNIALSTGSACSSTSLEVSHVLKSINKFFSNSSIRFSFGRFLKLTDVYFILKLLFFNIVKLRKISPLFYVL